MNIQEDCFGYINDNKCFALKEMYCKKKKCEFYRNKEETKQKYINTFDIRTSDNINKSIDNYFRNL